MFHLIDNRSNLTVEEIMRPLQLFFLIVLFPVLALAAKYPYEGSFQNVKTIGEGCDNVFENRELNVTLFFMGASKTQVVLHFNDPEEASLFNKMSLYGLYNNFNQRLLADNEIGTKSFDYKIDFDGYADRDFILGGMTVQKNDIKTGKAKCQAIAEYSAFPARE